LKAAIQLNDLGLDLVRLGKIVALHLSHHELRQPGPLLLDGLLVEGGFARGLARSQFLAGLGFHQKAGLVTVVPGIIGGN
jgi:hypothetical protein